MPSVMTKTWARFIADLPPALQTLFSSETLSALRNETAPIGVPRDDSRSVQPGDVFFALQGSKVDGHVYVDAVTEKNAWVIGSRFGADRTSVLVSQGETRSRSDADRLQIRVVDGSDRSVRKLFAWMSSWYFDHPSRDLEIVGVTGTSGKTTTTYLIRSILEAAGKKTGIIGTVENRVGEKTWTVTHTTPSAFELQRLLSEMKMAGARAVVMEVSSHALEQERVFATGFSAAAFLNLTPEHLDYHPSMDAYFEAKVRLFKQGFEWSRWQGKRPIGVVASLPGAVWNQRLLDRDSALKGSTRGVWELSADGIRGTWKPESMPTSEGISIVSSLVGDFNTQNVEVALSICHALGVAEKALAKGIFNLKGVAGRLERVDTGKKPFRVLVDYAHKPDALEKVLKTVRPLCRGKITLVFGCGGDRDKTKRPVMGALAEKLADRVIVTSDNPRTEDPSAIVQSILSGMKTWASVVVELDRRSAIQQAVLGACEGDIVLIAGKGHEKTQERNGRKAPFDDVEIARSFLEN